MSELTAFRIDAFDQAGNLTGHRYIISPGTDFNFVRSVLAAGERIGALTPLNEVLGGDAIFVTDQSAAVAHLPAVKALVEALQAARQRVKDLPSVDYDDASMLQLLLDRIDRALAPFEKMEG